MLPSSLSKELNYGRENIMVHFTFNQTYQNIIRPEKFCLSQDLYIQSLTVLMEVKKNLVKEDLISFTSLFLFLEIIQEGQRLLVSGETKFTAKKYFDIILSHLSIQEEQIIPILVSCLRTAVKVQFFLLSNVNPRTFLISTLFIMLFNSVMEKCLQISLQKWNFRF